MKNSRCGAAQALALALAASALAVPLGTLPAWADTTPAPTYQPWTGSQQGQAAQQLLKDLKAMVAQAEKDQAASPDFLADLKKLIAQYEAAATPSLGKPFFDDFADGEFLASPAWKVSAGTWSLDKSGSNFGLVSKIRQQQSLETLLGGILNPQGAAQPAKQEYAAIYTKAKLPGAFTFATVFTSKDRYGGFTASLYQGASAQNQYRVTYQPGNQTGLVLQRISPQGAVALGALAGGIKLEDGKPHELTLTRDGAGKMQVLIDGKLAITASDTTLKGDFDGVLLTNVGGSYWVRSVSVQPRN
ncbi:MAG: hypothetical protein JNL25_02750 [Rhodospirillaceae bacterium]|nr:hypothetical protein [Rhodospirillaceae bacterium]